MRYVTGFAPCIRNVYLMVVLLLASAACAQTERNIDPMIEEKIHELAVLTGPEYIARRDEFLASAPALGDYPLGLTDRDPRFRTQYLILLGWQRHPEIFRAIKQRRDSANVTFMNISAAGFDPFYNETYQLTKKTWHQDALPFAWEDILKLKDGMPFWQIVDSHTIISSYPDADLVDALLIALVPQQDRSSTAIWLQALAEMPADALKERLRLDTPFYVHARPHLQEALRRQD